MYWNLIKHKPCNACNLDTNLVAATPAGRELLCTLFICSKIATSDDENTWQNVQTKMLFWFGALSGKIQQIISNILKKIIHYNI